jgi:hypothetical protein
MQSKPANYRPSFVPFFKARRLVCHDAHDTTAHVQRVVPALLLWACMASFPTAEAGEPLRALPLNRHVLRADAAWRLNLPDLEPFGASGLLQLPSGGLLTVNDRGVEVFRVSLQTGTNVADLVMRTDLFNERQLAHLSAARARRFDVEGIARDDQGRIYLCDEAERWILRCAPSGDRAERLVIDWTPVQHLFSRTSRNASFEGIAIGGGQLFVANERSQAVIIVMDLDTLEVVNHFAPRPAGLWIWEPHYSDLSWHDDILYVLVRESHLVLAVDPGSGRVLVEYDYKAVELDPEFEHERAYPFVGVMEGLAVDREHIWLVTDNNHRPHLRYPKDFRPVLFRCPRPDR